MAAVEITGWSAYVARFQQLPEDSKKSAKAGFKKYAYLVARYARENKLSGQMLGTRTRTLFQSAQAQITGDGFEADMMAVKYGLYWHQGMPEVIKPKYQKLLAWKSDITYTRTARGVKKEWGGGWAYAKEVHPAHPLKRPFFSESVEETEQQRYDLVATRVIKAVEKAVAG